MEGAPLHRLQRWPNKGEDIHNFYFNLRAAMITENNLTSNTVCSSTGSCVSLSSLKKKMMLQNKSLRPQMKIREVRTEARKSKSKKYSRLLERKNLNYSSPSPLNEGVGRVGRESKGGDTSFHTELTEAPTGSPMNPHNKIPSMLCRRHNVYL